MFVPRSTSQYYNKTPYSPVIEIDDDSHSRFITDSHKKSHVDDGEDSETKRQEFRHPRNCLLGFSSDFYKLCSRKLSEINRVTVNNCSYNSINCITEKPIQNNQ